MGGSVGRASRVMPQGNNRETSWNFPQINSLMPTHAHTHTLNQPIGNLSDLPPTVTSVNLPNCKEITGRHHVYMRDQHVGVASEHQF